MDCLGATVIGVAGVSAPILWAGWSEMIRGIQRVPEPAGSSGDKEQRSLAKLLGGWADEPPGWLAWTLDMRNMLVHRGRRWSVGIMDMLGSGTGLVIIADDPSSLLRVKPLLPRDPARSDVEVWRDAGSLFGALILESSMATVRGIMGATLKLVEGAAACLLDLWDRRRSDPDLIPQPRGQWPNIEPRRSPGFDGFNPGPGPKLGSIGMSPFDGLRIKAAACADPDKVFWERASD